METPDDSQVQATGREQDIVNDGSLRGSLTQHTPTQESDRIALVDRDSTVARGATASRAALRTAPCNGQPSRVTLQLARQLRGRFDDGKPVHTEYDVPSLQTGINILQLEAEMESGIKPTQQRATTESSSRVGYCSRVTVVTDSRTGSAGDIDTGGKPLLRRTPDPHLRHSCVEQHSYGTEGSLMETTTVDQQRYRTEADDFVAERGQVL